MLFRIQPSGRLNSSHLIDQGYRFGTDQANEQTYVVPANKRTMALAGVPSDKDYSVQVLAYRNVDNDIDPSGIIQSATTTPMAGQHIPSRNVSFNGYVAGQPASTIAATAFNFNTRNDRDRSLIVDPVVATDGTAVDHVLNTDGSVDISFEWDWGGVDSSIDGWTIYVRSASVGGAYTFGAAKAEEQAYSLPADRRAIILPGVPANKYYTFFVQAYRIVDPDIAPNGLIVSAVVKSSRGEENPYQPQANVAFLGDIGGTINGTAVATLMTNVEQGTTAYLNTTEYRKSGPPSTNPTATGAVITSNSNGSRNIRLNWSAYTQGTNKADLLLIFWRKASTTPTVNDSAVNVNVNTTGTSYYIFEGVSPADVYSFGIAAARKSESGLEIGPIQTHASWTNLATTVPDFTGTVGGEDATQVAANAMNPAAQINAASTTIDPGKIKISGAVTLDNWRTTNSTTIDGGKITTGSVTADQIAAGSITATKVNIGDTSNMFGDPNMADTAYYQGSFTIFSTTNVNAAPNRLRTISSALEQIVTTGWTNVERDKPYYFSCMAYVETGTSTVRVQVEWYTATNGTLIRTDEVGTSTLNTTTPRIAGTFVAPSNARAVRFKWVKDASAAATEGSFGEPVIRRAANGELIVDGAIVASKIAAGAVSAGKMTVVAGGNIAENQLPNGMFIGTTGDTIGTVQTEASTAFDGTTAYRTSGVPTNNPTPTTTVGIVANTNGTRNVTLNWAAYTQGARKADFIMIFWKRAATAPTINDSSVAVNVNTAASYYIFEGIDPSTAISFGIAAARRTENGLEIGAIQTISQWTNLATATANFTGNIAGTAAATIRANALDPATVINSAATNIDPGKITIQGATTLADWRTPNTTTIDGGKITAFSIKAAQIEAGAITASKIVIGDSSNIVDNGWSAGSYDGWSVAGFLNWSLDGIEQGSAAGWRVASNARDQVTSQTISVTPGETYYLSAWVNNNDANVAQIMVFQNADRSLQNTSAFSVASTNDKGVWRRLEGQYTVPTGITALRMLLQSDRSSTGGNPTFWSKPVMRRATSGELVVNGAITGNKIAANSISAGHVEAGAITASKMAIRGENLFPDPQCQDLGWWKGPSQGTFSEPGRVVPVNNSNLDSGGWVLSTNGLTAYADRVGGSKGMWQLWSGGYTGTELTQVITPSMMVKAKTYYEISIGCTNAANRVLTLYAQAFTSAGVAFGTVGLFSFASGDSTTIIQRTKYQVPDGATSFRLFWETPASSDAFSGYINVGNISIREASTGTMIVDGSIEADHIKGDTITGNKFKSDTALPATLTIGTGGFSLNTVSSVTSKAVVSGNIMINTEFDGGLNAGYGVIAKQPTSLAVNCYKTDAVQRNIIKAEWTSVNTSTVVSLGNVDTKTYFTVREGDRLAYSCEIEGQGAVGTVQLVIRFRNGSGGIVGTATSSTSGGKVLGTIIGGFATVPANAITGQLELYTYGSGAGYVTQCFSRPMVSVVTDATSVLPVYSPGSLMGQTLAHAINANTTTIDPGKITISGSTTLANWRNGSNTTQIEGGAIAANSITANKLSIGNRNIGFIGLNFEWNPSLNRVEWSSGYIYWQNDSNVTTGTAISAGNTSTAAAHQFIYWQKGATDLNYTNAESTMLNDNAIQIATWWGGNNINVNYGGTIIHGDRITTGTINANRIVAGSITAGQIGAGQITASKMAISGDNLFPDPQIQDISWWKGPSQGTIADGGYVNPANNDNLTSGGWEFVPSGLMAYADRVGGSKGMWQLWSGPSNNGWTSTAMAQVVAPSIMAKRDTYYVLTVGCYNSSNKPCQFIIQYYDQAGNYLTGQQVMSFSAGDTGTKLFEAQFKTPTNCYTIRFYFEVTAGAAFSGAINVGNIGIREATTGKLVVDGTIETKHMTANTIEGDRIKAGTLNADRILSTSQLPATLTIGSSGFSLDTATKAIASANDFVSANGSFDAWGGTLPNNFQAWGNSGSFSKVAGVTYNNAIRITGNAGGNNGIHQPASLGGGWSLYNFHWVVIEADIRLNSGTLRGAGVLLRASGGGDTILNFSNDADTTGNINGDGVANTTFAFRKVVRMNSGSYANPEMYLMSHWTGMGSIAAANDITWYRAGWRFATEAEYNPAKFVNANTTQIDPGKILISGGTTLANWRNGSNTTQIEGGAIAANTITANKVAIGVRGAEFIGLTFDTNRSNQVTWTSATVVWYNDDGNYTNVGVAAGSANHTAGTTLYIWWNKGSGSLNAGTNPVNNINDIQLAQYWGGTNLYVTYGRTIIDGDVVKTGTVHANRLVAGSISANEIGAGQITANKLKLISSGLCPDPNFVDTNGFWGRDWNTGGWYAEESTNQQSRYIALWSGNPNGNPGTARKHVWSHYVESPGAGQPLRLRATMSNNSNQDVTVQVNFLNSSDATIASYSLNSSPNSGYQQYTTQFSVPSSARKIGYVIYNRAGGSTFSGSATVSGVQLDVAANAELIVDGSIKAEKIDTNAITSEKISAGAITASKLTLNGDNLWPDPQCQDLNWWKGSSQGTYSSAGYVSPGNDNNVSSAGWTLFPNNGHLSYRTAGSRGMWQLWSDGGYTSGATTQVVPPSLMAKSNTTYQFSVGVFNQCNKRVRFVLQEFSQEGNDLRGTELFSVPAGNGSTRLWDVSFRTLDATSSFRVYFEVEAGSNFNGYANVGNFTLREAATANMIVDGAISAKHIATGSITANKMTIGARPFSIRGMNMRVDTDGIMRWDGGQLQYLGDDGNYAEVTIPSGSAGNNNNETLYFVYTLGRPNLDWNNNANLATSLGSFHIATWTGGANLEVKSGIGTLINGGKIVTGSINADRIQSNSALPASLSISGTGFSLGTINTALANATPYDSYNGSFLAWSGQIPDGFIGWTGNGSWTKVTGDNGKNSIRIVATANGSNGIQQTGDGSTGAARWSLYTGRYVVIMADITLNSGTLQGAGVLLRASGGNDVTIKFAEDPDTGGFVAGNGNPNQNYSFRKVVRTEVGGNGRQEMYLMNHWAGIGAISTANDITWHNAGWRYATEAEINPAKYINQNSTQIDPGKIVISGTTSLANWRNGSNTTQIEGGAIAANTISANKLSIGNRNIGFIGLNFEWNPSLNRVEWSNGYIYWQNDSNVTVGTFIAAGNTGSAAAHQFIYWNKGEGGLNYTQTESLMLSDNSVQIATWWGGDNLNVNYGGTIIHGNRITTGTLNADRIVAGSITGDRIYSNAQLPASLTIGNTGFNLSSVENNARRQSGGNFMRNTDFEGNGVSGWGILYNPSNVSQSMTFDTFQNRRYMKIIGQMTGADQVISIGAVDSDVFGRVYGGTRIAFSVKTETQNAIKSVYLVARFRDGGNNIVGQLATAVVNGALPWGYQLGGFGDVPAGAVTVQLELYATSSTNGWLGMVLSEPMVSEVTASTTVLPAYSNGVTASKSLASAINANTTQIDPGKITISGGTTLANWRNGSNTTQIEGGAIAANTITANKLKIGNRNLNFPDLSFQVINGGATLRWDSFYVQWIDVNGNAQQVSIAAGSVSPGEGFWYIHWWEGNNSIGWTVDSSYATRQDVVCIATWLKGTNRVIQNYGATIIDGDRITTGTIAADKLSVTNLSAITANVGTLTAGVIQNSNGSSKFDISSGRIIFNNGTVMKVSGTGFGSANQFIEWFGPALSNVNQCAESNATSYLKIDGSAYFGGALLAGTLRNTNMTSILANNASAPVGPFGSNGGQIVVNASWSWDSTDTGQYAATAQGVNNYNAAISNLRSNGYTITDGGSGGRDHNGYKYDNRDGNAFALSITKSGGTVATEGGCNGYISLVGIRPEPADGQPGWIKYTYTYSKSITYTDPERSTTQRNFAATIVRNFTPSGTGNQRVGINTVE